MLTASFRDEKQQLHHYVKNIYILRYSRIEFLGLLF